MRQAIRFYGQSGKRQDRAVRWDMSRCNEKMRAQIAFQPNNSLDYSAPCYLHCLPPIVGDEKCFNRIEVDLRNDTKKWELSRKIDQLIEAHRAHTPVDVFVGKPLRKTFISHRAAT